MTCKCDACTGKAPTPHDPFRSRPSLSMWVKGGKIHYKEHPGRPGPLHPDYMPPHHAFNFFVLGALITAILLVLFK